MSKWIETWWNDAEGLPWCLPAAKKGDETPSSDRRKGKSAIVREHHQDAERWESSTLHKLTPTDWFRLHEISGHRLWIPPPAAMTTVMEQFAEDHLVNPHLAHVFVIPRLMTHLWRKHLFKDADLKFYVHAGAPFWPRSMHEPLTVVVVLPLAFVENYRGPWTARNRPCTQAFGEQLDAEFKRPADNGRVEFLDLDRPMPSLQDEACRWTWDILRKFLHKQRAFSPVQSGILRGLLPGLRGRSISSAKDSRRRRGRRGKRFRGGG